jgi:hypothetical protein
MCSIALIVLLCMQALADTSTAQSVALTRSGRDCYERLRQQFPVGESVLRIVVPSTRGKPEKLLSLLSGDAPMAAALPLSFRLRDRARVIATSRPQCTERPDDQGKKRCWTELASTIKRDREGELTLTIENKTPSSVVQDLRICVFDPLE